MSGKKMLLHICCAPDATVPWPELLGGGFCVAGFMYGGNIHPREEYEKRADALRVLSSAIGAEAVIEPWATDEWLAATLELAAAPEGGERCRICFALQLSAAARFASENGYTHLTTTLTISPHKDPALINRIGAAAAEKRGLIWVEKIWRRNDGFKRSVEMSKKLGLYRQNYCGCIYSERVTLDGQR